MINGVTDSIRFAPSACNTQPWYIERTENILGYSDIKNKVKEV